MPTLWQLVSKFMIFSLTVNKLYLFGRSDDMVAYLLLRRAVLRDLKFTKKEGKNAVKTRTKYSNYKLMKDGSN